MLLVYSRPLCSACQQAKSRLAAAGVKYAERVFELDRLSKSRLEDVMAMAMYHYQEETLPVFVWRRRGITWKEILELIEVGASWRFGSPLAEKA